MRDCLTLTVALGLWVAFIVAALTVDWVPYAAIAVVVGAALIAAVAGWFRVRHEERAWEKGRNGG